MNRPNTSLQKMSELALRAYADLMIDEAQRALAELDRRKREGHAPRLRVIQGGAS